MIYTFRLERAAIQIISLALGARPHSEVAALIAELQRQIDAQEAAARAQADAATDAQECAQRTASA